MIYNSNYKISISPITDNLDYEFRSLELVENIGGDLAQGVLVMTRKSGGEVDKLISNFDFYLESSNKVIKSSGHISEINVDLLYVTFHLTFCPKEFIYDVKSNYLSNSMASSISRLWKGSTNISYESNINNSRIYQTKETDYNCLRRLMEYYNKDVIYCFSTSGLVINSINNPIKKYDYPNPFMASSRSQGTISDLKYRSIDNHKINKELRYFNIITYDKNLEYTDKESSLMIDNYNYNIKNKFKAKMSTTNSFGEIPPYEICDKIELDGIGNKLTYIITNRKIALTKNNIKCTLEFSDYE